MRRTIALALAALTGAFAFSVVASGHSVGDGKSSGTSYAKPRNPSTGIF